MIKVVCLNGISLKPPPDIVPLLGFRHPKVEVERLRTSLSAAEEGHGPAAAFSRIQCPVNRDGMIWKPFDEDGAEKSACSPSVRWRRATASRADLERTFLVVADGRALTRSSRGMPAVLVAVG